MDRTKLPEGLMEVTISAYKPSGKWYASCTVRTRNIDLFSNKFIMWLKQNVPARLCPGSFYTVQSTDADCNSGNFHNHLFRYEDVWKEDDDRKRVQLSTAQSIDYMKQLEHTIYRMNRSHPSYFIFIDDIE